MIFSDAMLFAQFVSGLSRAMILFIMASGLTLVFGVMRVINFAHGSFYMMGAYLAFTATTLLAGSFGFWAAFLIVPSLTAVLGGVVEVFLLRRIYEKEHLLQMLLTFGLVFVFSDAVRMIWGVDLRMVSLPSYMAGSVIVLGHQFPAYHLFIIGLGGAIAVVMWLMLNRTNLGKLMRGAAEHREMVGLLGYPANRLFTIVFMMATFLGGLAGATIAPAVRISLGMDTEIIAECFTVAIIGGLGNVWGALLGALIAGMMYSFGILVLPQYAMAFIYILGGIVIVVRPNGLLGKSSPVKV
ncbi:MAG: branched-chain amino acid ABC transporter permease [Deltaproteobacteria bacterium]|nr:branched-chain amino acid ABC transporter permease [Deltaproteobacteria bacterium]